KNVCVAVDEVNRVSRGALATDRSDRWSIAHDGAVLERPVNASRLRIQRIDKTVVASDEDAARSDGRLRVGRNSRRKTESPLQFQSLYLGGREARRIRRLESGIRQIAAPAIPLRPASGIRKGRIAAALIRHVLRIAGARAAQRTAAHEFGHAAFIGVVELVALFFHAARCQGFINFLGRQFADRRRRWSALDLRIAVARHALSLECRNAVLRSWYSTLAALRLSCSDPQRRADEKSSGDDESAYFRFHRHPLLRQRKHV